MSPSVMVVYSTLCSPICRGDAVHFTLRFIASVDTLLQTSQLLSLSLQFHGYVKNIKRRRRLDLSAINRR